MHISDLESLPIQIIYIGKISNNEWPHYLYQVIINRNNHVLSIPYKCGLGHVYPNKFTKNSYSWEEARRNPKPKPPTKADIMYSLLADIACLDSFEDFCDYLGLDTDSIKALSLYSTCVEQSKQLHKLFSKDEIKAMQEVLADY